MAELEEQLSCTRFARMGHFRDSLGSTNDRLREMAAEGAPAGTFLIAGEQTAGRGRRGNAWSSHPGLGLYLSLLIRPASRLPPTLWTLASAVAACDACRGPGAVPATTIKWPNDLLIGSKKVGGILVESRSAGSLAAQLIIGIGINLHHDEAQIAQLDAPDATSLRLAASSGIVAGRVQLAAEFLCGFERVASALEEGRWHDVEAGWLARSPTATGSAVRVLSVDGTSWSGRTAGLAADGALEVVAADGTTHAIRQVDSVRFDGG